MKDIDKNTGEVIEVADDSKPFEEVVSKEESSSFGYDPVKDLHPVDPMGFINLRDAYVNRNVPTNIADDVANYNGIEDPESMLGTAKDIFEAYRMRDAIQKYESSKSEKGVSPSEGES